MTREEAISILKQYIDYNNPDVTDFYTMEDAIEVVIKALEQEPCEDAVSRQAVIDEIEFFQINPQHFDFVSMIDNIKDLPSVNPQKMGHWIAEAGDRETGYGGCTMCSECSGEGDTEMDYCPHCGARMGGAE